MNRSLTIVLILLAAFAGYSVHGWMEDPDHHAEDHHDEDQHADDHEEMKKNRTSR